MASSKVTLGLLKEVGLRQVWAEEDVNFTPWLAENISLLSSLIGMDLEVEALEKEVGPYRADIVCKDAATGNMVLIENQLEPTDHSHLGQLITYAVGVDAVTSVWVSSRFSDPHRAAIDRLNELTPEAYRFFGIEIEVWRIDGSDPAPRFKVVSKPNDWTAGSGSAPDSSHDSQLQPEHRENSRDEYGLGRFETVDIQELWPTEDRHFTPWLAGNLQELSDVLCIELELVDRKVSANSSPDILARQIPNDKYHEIVNDYVVIENHYGNADHDHSDSLLSYAEEFDAFAVVWISEGFRDEYREALDLLNRRKDMNTEFYAVEVEVLKINDSPPALRFELVVAPDAWYTRKNSDIARAQTLNSEFIERFSVKLKDHSIHERIGRRNYRSPYRIIEYPVSRVRYAATWHRGEPGFEVLIDGVSRDWNCRMFQGLEQERAKIEEELGATDSKCIHWQPPRSPNRDHLAEGGRIVDEAKIVVNRRGNVHAVDKEPWDEIQDWMISKLFLFRKVFTHRLKRLEQLVD